jgi:hypothetical protein
MYYRGVDRYGVKLAPAGVPDITPPSRPVGVMAKPLGGSAIELTWEPAFDDDTGIAAYKIYRNGIHIETVKGLSFIDRDPGSPAENVYSIAAVNYHGTEGRQSDLVSAKPLSRDFLPMVVAEQDCWCLWRANVASVT